MKARILSIAAAAILISTAGAASAGKAQSEEAKVAQAAEGKTAEAKKICKRLETSGTRLGTRACHTKAEWKKIEAGD